MNATIERIRNEAKTLSPDERELLLVTLDCDLHGDLGVNEVDESAKLKRLREAIMVGVEQLRAGQSAEFDAEDIITRGRARLAAKQAAAHA